MNSITGELIAKTSITVYVSVMAVLAVNAIIVDCLFWLLDSGFNHNGLNHSRFNCGSFSTVDSTLVDFVAADFVTVGSIAVDSNTVDCL